MQFKIVLAFSASDVSSHSVFSDPLLFADLSLHPAPTSSSLAGGSVYPILSSAQPLGEDLKISCSQIVSLAGVCQVGSQGVLCFHLIIRIFKITSVISFISLLFIIQ